MISKFCFALLLLAGPVLTSAQDKAENPRVEIFGGYSLLHSKSILHENAHGWETAFVWNANGWFGLKADFSGHYSSQGIPIGPAVIRTQSREYSYLFGPQFSARLRDIRLFVHGLAGGARLTVGVNQITIFGMKTSVSGADASVNGAAWALGGGADYNLSSHFAIRFAQFDYHGSHFSLGTEQHFRYSGGVVLNY